MRYNGARTVAYLTLVVNKQSQRSMKTGIKCSRPLLHFCNEGQKWPKSEFQSQFLMSKIVRIFLGLFSLNNINLEEHFLLL